MTGFSILVIEDDQVSAIVVTEQLKMTGAKVTILEDGRQALEALRREPFDLALMDVQMPIMDGVEATRAIRRGEAGADNAKMPIIAMTAYAMKDDKETFLNAGMDYYVVKPVEMADLRNVLRQVDRKRRLSSAS